MRRQSNNSIYRLNGASWTLIPGAAKELAGGSQIWTIGTNAVAPAVGIYQYNGSTWVPVPGAANHLSVDDSGTVWAIQ